MKKLISKIFKTVAFLSVGFSVVAGAALSVGKDNKAIETVASDKPVAVLDKMVDDWNGRLDNGGKYYWYLIHGTANFTSDGKAKYDDLSAAMGEGVKLNDKSFVSYGNSLLQVCYENGGKYITIKIPNELIVPKDGVGGCVVSFTAGTEFYDYQLPEISICIDCNTKKAALNATPVSAVEFKIVYNDWFAIKMPNYPSFAQWTTTMTVTRYGEIGLSFLDDIYVNGDVNQKLFLAKADMPSSTLTMTFNIAVATEGPNISFSKSILAVSMADITSLTIKQGATFPKQNGDTSYSKTESVVTDETYYLDGAYGYAIKETNVIGAITQIYGSHIGFYLEGADFYNETKSGNLNKCNFNLKNIYYNDNDANTVLSSSVYSYFNTLYDIGQGKPCFGLYGSEINAGVNAATSITIPAGTQFPNFQTCSKAAGNVVYVTKSEVRLVPIGGNEYYAESLGDTANYGVMTVSDFDPDSSGTITMPSAGGTHPFNKMSAISGTSVVTKYNMKVDGTTATEGNFELCSDFDVNHFRFKLSTGTTSASIKIQYGSGAGGWKDTTDLTGTTYFGFSNDTAHLMEFYCILVDSTHLRLAFAFNHKVLLCQTFKMTASTDIGRIVHLYMYQNGPGVTFTDYTNATAEGLNLFSEKGLLMKEVPTTEHGDTGACKGENGRYAKAKAYYNSLLTSAQKTAFASGATYADARARLTAWAAANGEVFNGTTFSSAKIGFVNENNDAAVIAIVMIAAVAVSILTCFYFYRRKKHN